MKRALMLACGNPLRGDDGFGEWMAAKVEEQFTRSEIEVVSLHQLTPEMAEPISSADTVIFLDCTTMTAPGEVSMQPVAPAEKLPRFIGHYMQPSTLLRLSQELYGRIPRHTYFITVGGKSFKMEHRLSDVVRDATPAVLSLVGRILQGANNLRWNLPGSEQLVVGVEEDISELSSV